MGADLSDAAYYYDRSVSDWRRQRHARTHHRRTDAWRSQPIHCYRKALTDPAVRQRLADIGQSVPPREQQTPEALGAFQKAEIEKWWPIIKAANIKGRGTLRLDIPASHFANADSAPTGLGSCAPDRDDKAASGVPPIASCAVERRRFQQRALTPRPFILALPQVGTCVVAWS